MRGGQGGIWLFGLFEPTVVNDRGQTGVNGQSGKNNTGRQSFWRNLVERRREDWDGGGKGAEM